MTAIAAWHLRHGCPSPGMGTAAMYLATGLFAQAQAVPSVFPGRGRIMLVTLRRMRHQLRNTLTIMRKAPASQHHATARMNHLAVGKLCAADPA